MLLHRQFLQAWASQKLCVALSVRYAVDPLLRPHIKGQSRLGFRVILLEKCVIALVAALHR